MKILIVDDIEVNRYYLESLLPSRGYQVASAPDGEAAVEILRQQPVDLIVSDILMPKKDGFQLCREVKANEQWRDIPFIFYTATYTDKKDEQLGLSIGAARFIIKPQEPAALMAQIEDVLRTSPKSSATSAPGEEDFLKSHNERLIQKLEHKIAQLEATNRALESAVATQKQQENERRLLEERYRQSQKMESIGTLAGGIAHDFNNMLSIIIPYAEMALADVSKNTPLEECLGEILKAAQRAKDMVGQILTFSRQAKSSKRPVLLESAVDEVAKMLRSTIPSTIEITVLAGPEATPVLADPVRIHQVLMNLCTNAAHAMRGKPGQMTIKLGRFTADENFIQSHPGTAPGDYVELSVADTGHGMDSETMKRIFEPFFTTKAPGEGTGMGLAVVHGIVKEHNGRIFARSEPGKGTTFQILFPACNQQPAEENIESKAVINGKGERILFVDDERQLTQMAGNILRRLNYRVQSYESPIEALKDFSGNSGAYDLIFTDLTMPSMTGVEFALKAREIRPDIPIILSTGYKCAIPQESADKLGVFELLAKPFTPTVMANAIHKALSSPVLSRANASNFQ